VEQREYKAGDPDDFERLYRSVRPRLLRSLNAILGMAEAEDCVQHAFEKAFRAWPRWKGGAPAEAWMYRIAINLAITYRRRRGLLEFASIFVPSLATQLASDAGPAPSPLIAALRQLPAEQAMVVVLRYYHGYSNREISGLVSVSERTVGSRLASGLKRLRTDLAADIADLGLPDRLSGQQQ